MSATNSSRLLGRSAGFIVRSCPIVLQVSGRMLRPHREPAPCAGNTRVSSGRQSSFPCRLSYMRPASSVTGSREERMSTRPTSPTNSVSPVSTAHGSRSSARSYTRNERLSGVWPGVSTARSRTFPRRISSPSLRSRCGYWASALRPIPTVAPVRAASSRCPETKSAWRWVSSTQRIVRPRARASSRYISTSREGSITAASAPSPTRYDACARQPT